MGDEKGLAFMNGQAPFLFWLGFIEIEGGPTALRIKGSLPPTWCHRKSDSRRNPSPAKAARQWVESFPFGETVAQLPRNGKLAD